MSPMLVEEYLRMTHPYQTSNICLDSIDEKKMETTVRVQGSQFRTDLGGLPDSNPIPLNPKP